MKMVSSVDDRFPLSFYFRIANLIVQQARVYRDEGNLVDLYLCLIRYSRLMSEIIPQHRSYLMYASKEKLQHRKILQQFNQEIENLEPLIAAAVGSNFASQGWAGMETALESYSYQTTPGSCVKHQSLTRTEGNSAHKEKTKLSSGIIMDSRTKSAMSQTSFPVPLTAASDRNMSVHAVKQYFPSPVLSCIESPPIVGHVSHVTVPESRIEHLEPSCKESTTSSVVQDLHISTRLMEEFMQLAKSNTEKNLETCGILGASLKNRTFFVTTLIVPKQESTTNSCQALNEEEIYAIQDQQSLFSVGWIHTHPSQTCFLSSIDLHTQYSYQVMLPEAVAIVMAPTDPTRSYGIFRVSDPAGINVLKECQASGFHQHPETADGSPIYESCSSVYINPNLRFEVIDLRTATP